MAALALVATVAAVGLAGPATAASKAPLGYQLMCLQTPEECQGGGKAQIVVTDEVMATLNRVNSRLNRSIKPRPDASGVDLWNANATTYGDCEDYVLAKRRALIKAGLPASSLRIAFVKTRTGEGHAILVVKTNGNDLVLDNLSPSIQPFGRTGYSIISISGANPRIWG